MKGQKNYIIYLMIDFNVKTKKIMTEFKTDAHLLQKTVVKSANLKTRIIKKERDEA